MVDTDVAINQPFFEKVLDVNHYEKIPGAYEKGSFFVHREYEYDESQRDVAVQKGVQDPLVAESNQNEETIVYDSANNEEIYKTWPSQVNNYISRDAVEYDPNTGNLFIHVRRYIYVFDPDRGVIVDSFYDQDQDIRELHLADSGGFAFTNDNGQFIVYDSEYRALYKDDAGGRARAVYYDSQDGFVYIGNDNNDFEKWDIDAQEKVTEFNGLAGTPQYIDYDPSGGDFLVAGSNYVSLFNDSDITTRVWQNNATSNTVQSAFFGDNGDIFIGMDDGTVSKISRADGTQIDNVNVGGTVSNIVLQNDGNILVGMRDNEPTLAIIEDNSGTLSVQNDTLDLDGVYGLAYDTASGNRYFWDGGDQIYRHPDSRPLTQGPDFLTYFAESDRHEGLEYDSTNDNFIQAKRYEIVSYDAETGNRQWSFTFNNQTNERIYGIDVTESVLVSTGRDENSDGVIRLHDLSDGSITERRRFENQLSHDEFYVYEESGTIEIYAQERDRGFVKLNDSLEFEWGYHQFNQGNSPSSYVADSQYLYVGHSDPSGIIKFNKSNGAIVERGNNVRTARDGLKLGPDNTLVGIRVNDLVRVIDRDTLDEVCCIYEAINTGDYDPKYIDVSLEENRVYVMHNNPYGIRSWQLETDKDARAYYQCTIYGQDVYVNTLQVTDSEANAVMEDVVLREGDTISSNSSEAYVVGVKRSDS